MKFIKWDTIENIEAYTITKKLGDMSYNNKNKELVLNNRKQLAKILNTDLDHMIAPIRFIQLILEKLVLKMEALECIVKMMPLLTQMLFILKMLIYFYCR